MHAALRWSAGCAGWCLAASAALASPAFEQVKSAWTPSDSVLLDRHGEPLHRLRTDAVARRGPWVALQDTSPALRTALVYSEDRRFYEHSGVDWRAVSAAAWANLWNHRTRGASTITMQLTGLLDEDLRRSSNGRSLLQKAGQSLSATRLETTWRKDQILEAYLNLVPYRGELVGIDALSRTLFGKAPHGLDQREAALTAALVRAPGATAPQVARRACGLLRDMNPAAGSQVCDGLDSYTAMVLQSRLYPASEGVAPHAARQLLRGAPGTRMRSTLDASLQRLAVQTLQQQLRELQGRHVEDGAVLVLDNRSGDILAWVGSSGTLSQAAEVDGVNALRQPGSTLKPFLYAQALAERRITAASLLEDSGTQIQTSGGLYIPQNYDHQFKGWVSARTALGASLNVPAVRTLVMVGPDAFQKQLVRLGLPLKESGDFYGYSLALGSAEVTLLQLTNAYRALANGGQLGEVSLQPGARPVSRQVLDPRAAFLVSDMLSDPLARSRTFGSDSVLATRFWSAVKTGTSKDMRDNWAVGYSQAYTVGVWVGNASGAPMWDVSGTSGAAPVWATLLNHLHRKTPSLPPTAPPGLKRARVSFGPSAGLEAAREEWFIDGTQQSQFALNAMQGSNASITTKAGLASAGEARITAPANGTIIALDPDIPPRHQQLALSARGQQLRWSIDGKELARGPQAQWAPWPGRHVIRLSNAQGELLDEVRIEVRGAGVRLAQAGTRKPLP